MSRKILTAIGAVLLVTAGVAGTALAGTEAAASPHGTISTVVGGPGGPAPATRVSVNPCALKYAAGELYFGSLDDDVFRVSQSTGMLSAVGGQASAGSAANGIPVAKYELSGCGVAVDGTGNILVAQGTRVVVVAAKTGTFYGKQMTAGRVYVVATELNDAVDVQVDASGNLVIADSGTEASHTNPEIDSLVQVVAESTGTFYGQHMVKGHMYVVAGGEFQPGAALGLYVGTLRLDSAGNIVLADLEGGEVFQPPQVKVIAARSGTFYQQAMTAGHTYAVAGGGSQTGNGVPGTSASVTASAVAFDHAGNVLIAANSVRVLAEKTGAFYGQHMTAGDIYTLPGFQGANAVAVDSAGNVLVGMENAFLIRMLAQRTGSYYGKSVRAGSIYTIAGNGLFDYSGDGGPATSAELGRDPSAVAANHIDGMVAVSNGFPGEVRVVPARTGVYFGRSMHAGFIYSVAGTQVSGFSGDGGPGTKADLSGPAGVAFDPAGNLVISDDNNLRVRVVANKSGTFYGRPMTAGDIYTIAGGGVTAIANGQPATGVALAGEPSGVAIDATGNVLLIDSAAAVWVRVVAARTGTFYGLRMTAGDIYTLAGDGTYGESGDGGPATAAEIEALGIAGDGAGNLVIADKSRVRLVAARTGTFYGRHMTAGDIYTVAGGGTQTADGTPAADENLTNSADLIAIDSAGNLLVDGYGHVWMVAEKAGSYYGKSMHAGDVYTVASSVALSSGIGDGGPATNAAFDATGLSIGPAGNLLISDSLTGRVRSVSR